MTPTSAETANLSTAKRALLEKWRRGESSKPADGNSIPPRPSGCEVPLSFSQERLWFLDQLQPGNIAYNMAGVIRLEGPIEVDVLEQTLGELIRRHEVLRTSFSKVENRPVQKINPPKRIQLKVVNLAHMSKEERERSTRELIKEEACRPFDLIEGPLVRKQLLRLSDTEHFLVYTLHHSISDGWSMGILNREFTVLYEAFSKGRPSPLADLPIQYGDYALWQRSWLSGENLEKQLSFWKQQLEGALPALDLPTDRPRPLVQTTNGATENLLLSAETAARLRALTQQNGATLFMTLLAAFKVLLFRYAGQKDLVVGTPIANRNRKEIEGLIGFFVNTIALRTRLTGQETFLELLARVRETTLSAYSHQDLPFEKLVEELKPERDLSRHPVFQVIFSLQNIPHEKIDGGNAKFADFNNELTGENFDLGLIIKDVGKGIVTGFSYNRDLFDASSIRRFLDSYKAILEAIVLNPDAKVINLPLFDATEQNRLLFDLNQTGKNYPAGLIHRSIEEQARQTPGATALVFGNEKLTYGQLNERANRLAHHLHALGVGPEVMVGICIQRSLEMVVGLLGILKAGGAYVPLDPTYPRQRLEYMLRDSQTRLLLTQESLLDVIPTTNATTTLCLDTFFAPDPGEKQERGLSSENPVVSLAPGNSAYMIYTSGSTGNPKGAINTHGGIYNRLMWMQEAYGLDASDRVLQKTPFSFDVSVWEFFWPLMNGATLVIALPGGHQDPDYLVETIRQQGITTLHFVPSMLHVFVTATNVESCGSLKRVICSGEALFLELQTQFHDRLGAELHNLYGPTEAAVDVTFWRCERNGTRRTVPIGRPIANVQMHILDAEQQPVPVGVAGELYIAGEGLGRGYHGRPELTGEKFLPNPFSAIPGARMYRTGDIAKYALDGAIEYLGRIDHQAKIRGFRIELGEIEDALRQHPAVQESLVLLAEYGPGDRRLVAYLVVNSENASRNLERDLAESKWLLPDLKRRLKERLPEYMIPSAFILLPEMPLLPNGKINRHALPAPEGGGVQPTEQFVAPRTALEEDVAGIWRELLRSKQVGVYDNFFELGGHSLLLTQLASRIRQKFEVELSLRTLFDTPTIEAMTKAISLEHAKIEAAEASELIDELKQLSPEEIKALLEAEGEVP